MSCEKPLSFEELRELRSRDLMSYRASEEIQRQEKKLEGYRWFAKAWKRAAKQYRDCDRWAKTAETLGSMQHLMTENLRLGAANAALKAKIEALPAALIELMDLYGPDSQPTDTRLREFIGEHFGEGK